MPTSPAPPTAWPPAWRAGGWDAGTVSASSCPRPVEAVAAIHGVLRSGAAYVPVDPTAPATRGAGIFADGGVKAIVVAESLAPGLREAWPGPCPLPRLIVVGDPPHPLPREGCPKGG
jgi:non-ribosomal peptide synthetase component F